MELCYFPLINRTIAPRLVHLAWNRPYHVLYHHYAAAASSVHDDAPASVPSSIIMIRICYLARQLCDGNRSTRRPRSAKCFSITVAYYAANSVSAAKAKDRSQQDRQWTRACRWLLNTEDQVMCLKPRLLLLNEGRQSGHGLC